MRPYRALVEQMHEGAVTLTVEGAVIYANRSFARLVDVPLEQVIGSSINRFVVGRRPCRCSTLLIRSGAGTLRTCLLAAGQTLLDVHISVSHVTVDEVEHRTLIVTDMSTLTKVQRESQSKDEFLAMLAHELRNPLAPIRTGLQVLRLQARRRGRRAHARDDGAPGRAHGAAHRRPAGRLARQPREDRAQEGADRPQGHHRRWRWRPACRSSKPGVTTWRSASRPSRCR